MGTTNSFQGQLLVRLKYKVVKVLLQTEEGYPSKLGFDLNQNQWGIVSSWYKFCFDSLSRRAKIWWGIFNNIEWSQNPAYKKDRLQKNHDLIVIDNGWWYLIIIYVLWYLVYNSWVQQFLNLINKRFGHCSFP